VLFLLAYWFYIDGVNTIIKMAVNYGVSLGLDTNSLLTALLVTQFVGFPAALLFGYLGDRIGAKRGILIGLVVYAGITVYAYFLDSWRSFMRGGDRRSRAGWRAEPVPFVVRSAGARRQERRVFRLLQYDG
jgi:MFS-type transporter involved in bile tolerance (Atg22 family)